MADLIDRDAVLHDISTECSNAYEAKYYEAQVALTRAKRIICDAPAVNRWISVEDALPEDNAEVLVSFCRRYVKIGYIEPGDGLRYWVIPGHSVVPINYIEAWMQMPDAYEPPEKE